MCYVLNKNPWYDKGGGDVKNSPNSRDVSYGCSQIQSLKGKLLHFLLFSKNNYRLKWKGIVTCRLRTRTQMRKRRKLQKIVNWPAKLTHCVITTNSITGRTLACFTPAKNSIAILSWGFQISWRNNAKKVKGIIWEIVFCPHLDSNTKQ